MIKLEAIIKPFKLEAVRDALAKLGVDGMTATEVKGCGRKAGYSDIQHGTEYTISFLPKIKIELVIPDLVVEAAIAAVIKAAKTGKSGDGKIFVTPILNAIRIRTAESGEQAVAA